MRRALFFCVALVLVVVIAGCYGQAPREEPEPQPEPSLEPEEPAAAAVAYLEPKSGSGVTGSATFEERDGEVVMTLDISGAPAGTHAAHIHEIGDCSAEDAKSAGGHWNPGGVAHGRWGEEPFHLGDIGNVDVGEDGNGSIGLTTDLWSVGTGADNDVVGKSVIVHAAADDFTSQPTGAAGGRIACGVVELQ